MRYIYLDNFRGFSGALIPLLDVTFCVGENSTGKTSFLTAIKLLSSHKFWFDQKFDPSIASAKHFNDYVSVGSNSRLSFRIGIVAESRQSIEQDSSERERLQLRGFLFEYVERDGVPTLASVTTNYEKDFLTVYFKGASVRYRAGSIGRELVMSDFEDGMFEQWKLHQRNRGMKGAKVVKEDAIRMGYAPPLYLLSAAAREAFRERDSDGRNRPVLSFPTPPFESEAAWIAPIRSKPRRTYDEVNLEFTPEGTHSPYLIKKLLVGGAQSIEFERFLKKFGRESGLFKEVRVHRFGKSVTSPFELEIVLESKPLNMGNVGYGVSQSLPVAVEMFARRQGTLFAIQQPEVHLHPRAQASIGELIFNMAAAEKKTFVIETHSDFTLDRFRCAQRSSKKKVSSQVLFFDRTKGVNTATPIAIDGDGELSSDQPQKYREFFVKESLKVIGL
jgi:predicted ATPase